MIVINARFLTQERRGTQRFAEEIGQQLKKQRDDVVFVAPRGALQVDQAQGLGVRQIGLNRGALWEQLDLPLWLARNGRPLLLSLGNTAPVGYGNQIATHHDLAHVHHSRGFASGHRLRYRLLLPPLLRRVHHLLTVSQFSRQQISERYGLPEAKISVVSNAASGCFQPAANEPDAEPAYLLAVCAPRAHKNLARAIEAFLSLTGVDDVELRIVSGNNSTFSLPGYVPLDNPRIQVLGRLSDEELLAQYQGARALVLPSLYEGFGMPALEAQASGCPVIAASTPALMETLGDSALFFDPEDVPELALCMRRVLREPTLRALLRARGLENARRYSWEASAAHVSALLDSALALSNGQVPTLQHPVSDH